MQQQHPDALSYLAASFNPVASRLLQELTRPVDKPIMNPAGLYLLMAGAKLPDAELAAILQQTPVQHGPLRPAAQPVSQPSDIS